MRLLPRTASSFDRLRMRTLATRSAEGGAARCLTGPNPSKSGLSRRIFLAPCDLRAHATSLYIPAGSMVMGIVPEGWVFRPREPYPPKKGIEHEQSYRDR